MSNKNGCPPSSPEEARMCLFNISACIIIHSFLLFSYYVVIINMPIQWLGDVFHVLPRSWGHSWLELTFGIEETNFPTTDIGHKCAILAKKPVLTSG
jgi:hypothetical protein